VFSRIGEIDPSDVRTYVVDIIRDEVERVASEAARKAREEERELLNRAVSAVFERK
jgi:hypothetical protein